MAQDKTDLDGLGMWIVLGHEPVRIQLRAERSNGLKSLVERVVKMIVCEFVKVEAIIGSL